MAAEVFVFSKDYVLETELALLRPLQAEDINHLIPFALHEPDLWTYSLISAAGEPAMQRYIAAALKDRADQKEYPFIVFDKRTQEYAGCTRFYDIQLTHQTTQLGYTWYGKKFQGSGLNKHCKYLLLSLAFDTLQWERVEFRADYRNHKSIQAMKSIGCIEEGVLRSNCSDNRGGRRDSIVLSILRKEWQESIKDILQQKCDRSK